MEDLLLQAGEMTILISSHELPDIENVATHVGFIDAGRMLLEESMSDMHSRLREVRVTLDRAAVVPQQLPKEWLRARAFDNVLTFVDSRYSPTDLGERLRALVAPGTVRQIDAEAMPLRTVFTTLARAAREGGVP